MGAGDSEVRETVDSNDAGDDNDGRDGDDTYLQTQPQDVGTEMKELLRSVASQSNCTNELQAQ